MEQTNNIVGNFRVSIGGVIITFNVMDNPETIVADLAKANTICDNVLAHLSPVGQMAATAKKAAKGVEAVAKAAEKVAEAAKPATADTPLTSVDMAEQTQKGDDIQDKVMADAAPEVVNIVEAEPVYTLADMRKLLSEIIDLGHRPAAEQYVQYHCKTKRTSEIPVEKYPAIMRDLTDLAAGLKAGAYNSYDDFAKAKGYELSSNGQE